MLEPPVKPVEWIADAPDSLVPGRLRLIDQTALPGALRYVELDAVDDLVDAIRRLVVRGAPAIGVAAAFGVLLGVQRGAFPCVAALASEVERVAERLAAARPTAVNLFWALARMRRIAAAESGGTVDAARERLAREATAILAEDLAMGRAIGEHGAALLRPGMGVLTHCNAGALATSGYGTALAPVYVAHQRGITLRVFADETRPLLQGARLTAWELSRAGLDVTLLCDGAAGHLLREGRVDIVIVGADRVAANGDTANKVGTYTVARLAAAHGVPFYVALPSSTFDLGIRDGSAIPIEHRDGDEVVAGFGRRTAPAGVKVYNPAFDVTPHELIAGFITERGILRPPYALALTSWLEPAARTEPLTPQDRSMTSPPPVSPCPSFPPAPPVRGLDPPLSAIGEIELIERLARCLQPAVPPAGVLLGIGDDAAVLDPGAAAAGSLLVLKTDAVVEGVHFAPGEKGERVGWKAICRALSDLAAMGARPRWGMITLMADPATRLGALEAVYRGMQRAAERFEFCLVGGETVRLPGRLALSVALAGEVERGRFVGRGGARPGHALLVTGRLGGSLQGKHLDFVPRLAEARRLVERAQPAAMIDISDGLARDLLRVCRASAVGVELWTDRLPIAEAAVVMARADGRSALDHALDDGEDYELLVALDPGRAAAAVEAVSGALGTELTEIGRFVPPAEGCSMRGRAGRRELCDRGYDHFGANP